MSVHKAISAHVNKQNKMITDFLALDKEREHFIEEAVSNCQSGMAFSADKINGVTAQINELAKKGIVPTRKFVTEEMIKEYTEKIKS
ncbi:YpbS family protein [Bacillus sp. Bva_UNVM-123]|uniref:YpbS family protein n=1 Tax=Bacillus sp. Bva_UNVM-123 TaxID=2829798 RepID=UPI00391F3D8E